MAIISNAAVPQDYNYPVTRVIDGDTLEVQAPFLPQPLKPTLLIRLIGIDTPEKYPLAKCKKEADLSAMATDNVRSLISSAKTIQVKILEWDKYGGRVLGYVYVDGQSLADLQVSKGFARAYYGGTKSNWCM